MPRAAPRELSIRDELFAQALAAGATLAAAHKAAGLSGKSPTAPTVEGRKRLKKPLVAKRVEELREQHAKKHEYSVEGQLRKLEEIRVTAVHEKSHSAAVAAVVAQNRLLGFDQVQLNVSL